MSAWLFEVIEVLVGLAFAASVVLFIVGIIIRFGNKEKAPTATVDDLLQLLESNDTQDDVGLTVTINDEPVFLTQFPLQVKKLYFDLEKRYEITSHELGRVKEAYQYMQGSAGAAIFGFVAFRIIH